MLEWKYYLSEEHMNRFWIILGVVVIGMIGLFFITKEDSTSTTITGDATKVLEQDHVRGDRDAPIVLIEYGDFQCPACASYYPMVKSLEEKYPGQVQFVFRHFPLSQIHPNAFAASRAAEAAGSQGKFFEMHDKLYETQALWGSVTTNQQSLFEGYAEELGLDMGQFKEDYKSTQVADRINFDIDSGTDTFGVQSTPTFILQGEKIDNPQDVAGFEKLIDEALAKAGVDSAAN